MNLSRGATRALTCLLQKIWQRFPEKERVSFQLCKWSLKSVWVYSTWLHPVLSVVSLENNFKSLFWCISWWQFFFPADTIKTLEIFCGPAEYFCISKKIIYSEGMKDPARLAEGIFPDVFPSCGFPWEFQVSFDLLLNPKIFPKICGAFGVFDILHV